MRNCLVFGSRRSGSSLLVGALSRAGYHVGDTYSQPTPEHPAGSFDAEDIAAINDTLLLPQISLKDRYRYERRWLALPAGCVEPKMDGEVLDSVQAILAKSPWCFCDSRFCFTLPAWRSLLGDTGFVCVFRHPAESVSGMIEECGGSIDIEHAFDVWTATYREILERESEGGSWLFIHHDQLGDERGRGKLAEFLGTELDANDAEASTDGAGSELEAPPEGLEIYDELCRRAGRTANEGINDDVAVLSIIDDELAAGVPELIESISDQHGVHARLYLIDATRDGLLRSADPNTVVMRARSASRGRWIREALSEIAEPFIAFARPDCVSFKTRLALARRELTNGAHVVTCNYTVLDEDGTLSDRSNTDESGDALGPFWEAGLVVRREALASISCEAFFPIELDLLCRLRGAGLSAHVNEPGFVVSSANYVARIDRAREDAELVAIHAGRTSDGQTTPELTVSIVSNGAESEWTTCLESLCRQTAQRNTFEVVITHTSRDQAYIDRVRSERADVEFPISVRHVDCAGANEASARNRALSIARGALFLTIDSCAIAPSDLIEGHLRAHASSKNSAVLRAVTGPIDEPSSSRDIAFNRYLQTSILASTKRTVDEFELTLDNFSVAMSALTRIGGFDESMSEVAGSELALRLASVGCEIVQDASVRAVRESPTSFAELRERTLRSGRRSIRLARKFPDAMNARGEGQLELSSVQALSTQTAKRRRKLEDALSELGAIDVGSLETLGDEYTPVAERVLRDIDTLMPELLSLWRNEGQIEGFHAEKLESLSEITAHGTERWPIWTRADRTIFAWPDWRDPESLRRVLELFEPAAELGGTALILAFDERVDGTRDDAAAQVDDAYSHTFADDTDVEVVLEGSTLGPAELHRIGRSVDAVLRLGSEPARFFDLVIAEVLDSTDSVIAWSDRFRDPEGSHGELAPESKAAPVLKATPPQKPQLRGSRGRRRDSSHPARSSSEGE